jgi:hypothetical protein
LAKLADSGQNYHLALAQGFAAGGVVTISGKMDLFWALCRGGVEISEQTNMVQLEGVWNG